MSEPGFKSTGGIRITRPTGSGVAIPVQSLPPDDVRERQKRELEEAFRMAMEAAWDEQAEVSLASIGRRLVEQAGGHMPLASVPAPAESVPNAPSDMLWSVKEAVEKKKERQRRPVSTTDQSDTAGKESQSMPWGEGFELQSWLESLNLVERIEKAVCHPLKDEDEPGANDPGGDAGAGMDAPINQQEEFKYDYLVSIGAHSSYEPLAKMLNEQKLTDLIAQKIWANAQMLRPQTNEDLEAVGGSTASKFFEDEGRALRFGDVGTFYQGLDGFLGPPNPNIHEAMEDEHVRQPDSQLYFCVPNYKTQTTPKIEFWFVAEPTDERLKNLELKSWPKEPDLQRSEEDREVARKPRPPQHFEAELADRNARLREIGMEKILEEELIAARLCMRAREPNRFAQPTLCPMLPPSCYTLPHGSNRGTRSNHDDRHGPNVHQV